MIMSNANGDSFHALNPNSNLKYIYSYISIVLYNLYIVHKRMHKVFIDVTLLHICSTILYVSDIRWGTSPLCFISMIAGCQETR